MSGIQMIEKIRKIDNQIPVIFITGNNSNEALIKSIKLGISAYVPKPINFSELLDEIKKSSEKLYVKYLLDIKNKEIEKKIVQIERIKEKYQNEILSLRTKLLTLDEQNKKLMSEDINSMSDDKKMNILKKKNEEIQNLIKTLKNVKQDYTKALEDKKDYEIRYIKQSELLESYKSDLSKLRLQLSSRKK